jgi:hypothetical protein
MEKEKNYMGLTNNWWHDIKGAQWEMERLKV